jgi:exonuclease I
MSENPQLFHYVFDHENVDVLQKMVNEVASDPNKWMDVVFKPRSYQLEEENTPVIEIAEMKWENDIRQTVVVRDLKLKAIPLE